MPDFELPSNQDSEPLRQGSLLDPSRLGEDAQEQVKNSRALETKRNRGLDNLLVVLSQDCDIFSGRPLEVVSAKRLSENRATKELDGNYDKPKNYQKLIVRHSDEYFVLKTENIMIVDPKRLPADKAIVGHLTGRETDKLVSWRTGCYNREPFPDAFNRPFQDYMRNEGLWDFLEARYDQILDLYVFVNPRTEEYAEEYDVSMTAILNDEDRVPTEDQMTEIRERLEAAAQELSEITKDNPDIATLNCGQVTHNWLSGDIPSHVLEMVVTPDDFTLRDQKALRIYNTALACFPDLDDEE